jgi:hypothetical protein
MQSEFAVIQLVVFFLAEWPHLFVCNLRLNQTFFAQYFKGSIFLKTVNIIFVKIVSSKLGHICISAYSTA